MQEAVGDLHGKFFRAVPGPLAPDERARVVAELRHVLDGTAPTFRARMAEERRDRP